MRAEVSSGRSDCVRSWPTNADRPLSPVESTLSTVAAPPSSATGSNEVARTETSLSASLDCTVAIALPA